MTALIIVFSVLLLIFILLLIPVSADFLCKDKVLLKVKYGGIKVFDTNKTKKQGSEPSGEEHPKENKKKDNFISQIFKEKGKIDGIKYLFTLIKLLLSRIIWLIKKIEFKKIFLDITVSSDDAATTAVSYGALCGVVYPVVNIIGQNGKIGFKEINIRTDFDKLSPLIEIGITAKTRLIYAVIGAIVFIFEYLRLKKESEKNGRK